MLNSIIQKFYGGFHLFKFQNKWELILRRLFSRVSPIVIYNYNGVEYLENRNAGDANSIDPSLFGTMYQNYIKKMQLPPSISVLDLGANCGGFSLMLLTMGYTLDKLLAVEMNPRTFSRLQFNLYHNISPLPTAINCAITGKEQICQIDDISGDTGQSIFENTTDTLISVPGTTIDAIISHHFPDSRINLCKIDIEGAEYDVVEKMNYKLLTKCDYIIIEIHKNSKYGISYIKDALISLGFIEQFIDAQTHSDVFCFENTFKTNS